MNRTFTSLLTDHPAAAVVSATVIAALAAAGLVRGLGPLAAAVAALTAAAYTCAAMTAWRSALRRKRLGEAARRAADAVAALAADLAAGTDPDRAAAAVEADWPPEATATTRRLTAAWRVAAALGAPTAELCRRLAEHLREDERAAARTRAQTASIRATATLLTVLPVGGIALGEALGVEAIGFLLATGPGIACLAAAMALQAAGIAWTRALTASIASEVA
ncbi:type II secretion system F family protein [Glycomyces salinus]|uniref:type II secretion system F family protein n=1 Tax=Glycomyces salinus TaxID=980294 RepID=UPI0018EAE40A|nr:type II secretion system F family protein [Glycomyces salinus]